MPSVKEFQCGISQNGEEVHTLQKRFGKILRFQTPFFPANRLSFQQLNTQLTTGMGTYLWILLHQSYTSKSHRVLAPPEFNELVAKGMLECLRRLCSQSWKSPAPQLGCSDWPPHILTPWQSRVPWVWQHTGKGVGKGLELADMLLWSHQERKLLKGT